MHSVNWISIIYGIGVLLLISPLIMYVFRAPNALRNAALWLAIIAALGWGYKYFGHLLPDDVVRNMERGGYYQDDRLQPAKPEDNASKLPEEQNDNPVRNQ